MKPTKNRYYCTGCGKPKMLFETRTEAEAFLRYNTPDILQETGKAPVRAYYCRLCNGWHITSLPMRKGFKPGKSKARIVMEDYNKSILERARKNEVPTMDKARMLLDDGQYHEAALMYLKLRDMFFTKGTTDMINNAIDCFGMAVCSITLWAEEMKGNKKLTLAEYRKANSLSVKLRKIAMRHSGQYDEQLVTLHHILSDIHYVNRHKWRKDESANAKRKYYMETMKHHLASAKSIIRPDAVPEAQFELSQAIGFAKKLVEHNVSSDIMNPYLDEMIAISKTMNALITV